MARDRFTMAAAGDALVARRLSVAGDDRADEVYGAIRDADASVVNLETLLHDYEGPPAAESIAHFSGLYLRAPPWVADELSWAGFDLFAAASNHSGDYSHEGMATTARELERRDLPYAGLGENLADARAPAFVDTPGGRVALVAAVSTLTPGTEAGPRQPNLRGRPGVSPLRLDTRYVLPPDRLDQLREMSEALGLEEIKRQRESVGLPTAFGDRDDAFGWLDVDRGHGSTIDFEAGDPGVYQHPDEDDREAILAEIEEAAREADRVIASLHAHEGENGAYNDRTVAPFVEAFARDCVDAGADAFVGHGPHTLRGIEVYDGAPILYSLGNFIAQYESITRQPAEVYDRYGLSEDERRPSALYDRLLTKREYFESVLPVCTFDGDGVAEIRLLPVELGYDDDPPRHGAPKLATGGTAERILGRLADLSEPYGVEVGMEDGLGVVEGQH